MTRSEHDISLPLDVVAYYGDEGLAERQKRASDEAERDRKADAYAGLYLALVDLDLLLSRGEPVTKEVVSRMRAFVKTALDEATPEEAEAQCTSK